MQGGKRGKTFSHNVLSEVLTENVPFLLPWLGVSLFGKLMNSEGIKLHLTEYNKTDQLQEIAGILQSNLIS